MFTIQAPYPALEATTQLPNPLLGDSEALTDTVEVRRAMDGTMYTFVKTKERRRLEWTFRLTRNRGEELKEFFVAYASAKIKVTDHNGRVWVGNFVNDPFEFTTTKRAAPAIAPLPRGEQQQIKVEFEGIEQ